MHPKSDFSLIFPKPDFSLIFPKLFGKIYSISCDVNMKAVRKLGCRC